PPPRRPRCHRRLTPTLPDQSSDQQCRRRERGPTRRRGTRCAQPACLNAPVPSRTPSPILPPPERAPRRLPRRMSPASHMECSGTRGLPLEAVLLGRCLKVHEAVVEVLVCHG